MILAHGQGTSVLTLTYAQVTESIETSLCTNLRDHTYSYNYNSLIVNNNYRRVTRIPRIYKQ